MTRLEAIVQLFLEAAMLSANCASRQELREFPRRPDRVPSSEHDQRLLMPASDAAARHWLHQSISGAESARCRNIAAHPNQIKANAIIALLYFRQRPKVVITLF